MCSEGEFLLAFGERHTCPHTMLGQNRACMKEHCEKSGITNAGTIGSRSACHYRDSFPLTEEACNWNNNACH